MKLSPAIDVVTEHGPLTGAVMHARTAATRNPRDQFYDGAPSSGKPACKAKPGDERGWREVSAGRATELGAVPCPDTRCFAGKQ